MDEIWTASKKLRHKLLIDCYSCNGPTKNAMHTWKNGLELTEIVVDSEAGTENDGNDVKDFLAKIRGFKGFFCDFTANPKGEKTKYRGGEEEGRQIRGGWE